MLLRSESDPHVCALQNTIHDLTALKASPEDVVSGATLFTSAVLSQQSLQQQRTMPPTVSKPAAGMEPYRTSPGAHMCKMWSATHKRVQDVLQSKAVSAFRKLCPDLFACSCDESSPGPHETRWVWRCWLSSAGARGKVVRAAYACSHPAGLCPGQLPPYLRCMSAACSESQSCRHAHCTAVHLACPASEDMAVPASAVV